MTPLNMLRMLHQYWCCSMLLIQTLVCYLDGLKCLHISGTKTQPMAVGPSLYEYKFNLDDKDVETEDTLKILGIVKRVWKGIFGIRDLTKIQCGIRENAKYLDEIREYIIDCFSGSGIEQSLGTRRGHSCLIVRNSGNFYHLDLLDVRSDLAKANQPGECRVCLVNSYLIETVK